MVERKRRIAGKPNRQSPPPAADQWVNEQVDPEVSGQVATDSSEQVTNDPKEEGKAYPHRISFDMATPQYKRLKWAAFDSDQSMNEILREAVENWMQARNY